MDEWDPDWPGDPKISTLKEMAFKAKKDINTLIIDLEKEAENNSNEFQLIHNELQILKANITQLKKENDIATLYFKGVITKEEAESFWNMYKSPDPENHEVAREAITGLLLKHLIIE